MPFLPSRDPRQAEMELSERLNGYYQHQKAVQVLIEENRLLREGIRYYADQQNYKYHSYQNQHTFRPIDLDKGAVANMTLDRIGREMP